MAYEGAHPFPVASGGTGASTLTTGQAVVANGTSPFTTIAYSSLSGTNTLVERDANGNFIANNIAEGTTNNVASGTITLTVASTQTQVFLSGSGTATCILPDATTLVDGWLFVFNNNAGGIITIETNGGSTLFTMAPGSSAEVILLTNSFPSGTWDHHWVMPSSAQYGTTGLTVTGTITGTTSVSSPQHLVTGSSTGIISILPQAAAGTYNFNLPTSAGTSGLPLLSGGGGATPMQFAALTVPGGGTGLATLTAHAVLVGEGISNIGLIGPSATAGSILMSGGSSADPAFVAPTAGSGLSVTTNASTLSYAITAPVSIANGGTNATSFATSNGIAKYDGTRLVSSSTFTINASNFSNNSSQPLVSAFVNANVSNVTGDGTTYVPLFNTVLVNNSSSYVAGTGVFTAPVAGNYLVTGSIGISGLGAANSLGIISIGFTGRTYQVCAMNYGAVRDANNNLVLTFSVIHPMALSDQVLLGLEVSNGTKVVGVLGDPNPLTYLGIYLLS